MRDVSINELLQLKTRNFGKAYELTKRKGNDYSASETDTLRNVKAVEDLDISTVENGILVRLTDKLMRLRGFCKGNVLQVKDETVEDMIIDAHTYLDLLHMVIKAKSTLGQTYPIRSVYLSGPIKDVSGEEAAAWREEAEKQLSPTIRVYNPLLKGNFSEDVRRGVFTEIEWLVETDKSEIDASDCLLVYPFANSYGTAMEVLYGWERGKQIYMVGDMEKASPWLKHHSHKWFLSVEGACKHVLDMNHNVVENGRL